MVISGLEGRDWIGCICAPSSSSKSESSSSGSFWTAGWLGGCDGVGASVVCVGAGLFGWGSGVADDMMEGGRRG